LGSSECRTNVGGTCIADSKMLLAGFCEFFMSFFYEL
jgi:hypothetical protein